MDHRGSFEADGKGGHTLGLHSSGIGDEEGSVVGDESLLDLEGRGGVDVLGVVLSKQSMVRMNQEVL